MLGGSPEARGGAMLTARTEARDLVLQIAGPLRLGENVKGALARVARATGLTDRRVRGIWHSEARSITAVEMDRLRHAARDARALEQARDEHRTVLAQIAACDAALGLPAPDLGGAPAAALGEPDGGEDRTLDQGA